MSLTPAVAILAILGFMIWHTVGPEPRLVFALIVAVTTLIIACPCALGMATPMSLTTGIGLGALNGILIRGGDALQTAQGLQTIILDKTGTITHGKPVLTDVVVTGAFREEELLRLAGGVEKSSEHPLAAAVSVFMKDSRSKKVTVLGQVVRPGTFPYTEVMSIGEAISLAGGFTRLARMNRVLVTRVKDGNQEKIYVAVEDIARGKAPNFYQRPGDTVYVEESLF